MTRNNPFHKQSKISSSLHSNWQLLKSSGFEEAGTSVSPLPFTVNEKSNEKDENPKSLIERLKHKKKSYLDHDPTVPLPAFKKSKTGKIETSLVDKDQENINPKLDTDLQHEMDDDDDNNDDNNGKKLLCIPSDSLGLSIYSSITLLTPRQSLHLNQLFIKSPPTFYHFHPENTKTALYPHYETTSLTQDIDSKWKAAFISLYQHWMDSHTNLFYYFHADEFCCCFYRDVMNEIYAVVDKSTPVLNICLSQHGFSLCNNSTSNMVILASMETSLNKPLNIKKSDHKNWSKPLIFTGQTNVHLFYDFLLNNKVKSFANKRLESCHKYLIGQVPFIYSSVGACSLGPVSKVLCPSTTATKEQRYLYQQQILGPLSFQDVDKLLRGLPVDDEFDCILNPLVKLALCSDSKQSMMKNLAKKISKTKDGFYEIIKL